MLVGDPSMRRAFALLFVAFLLVGIAWLVARQEQGGSAASPSRSSGESIEGEPEAVAGEPGRPEPVADGTRSRRISELEPAATSAVPAGFPVSGVVLDEVGLPITDAEVFIGAEENPFDGAEESESSQWDEHTGLTFPVGPNGEFRAWLPRAQPVFVCADGPTVTWDPELLYELWVTPPREDLVLRLRRVPYATLVVRAHDGITGRDLDKFKVSVSAEGKTFQSAFVNDGVRELVLTRLPPGGRTFTVKLLFPETEEAVQEAVHLVEGETRELVLQVFPDRIAEGLVTNSIGEPIEGVLVYFGDLTTVVSNELGEGADPGRAVGSVRSDAQGRFRLSGGRAIVTFWHPAYRSTTLLASDGMKVTLENRGRIVGTVAAGLDPGEARLDGETEPRVLQDGSFAFENVDAGFHMFDLPGVERLSVILTADETVVLDRDERIADAILRLRASGVPLEQEFEGALFGLSPVASLVFFSAFEGAIPLGDVIPGEYLLWAYGGHASIVSIESAETEVDVGALQLTVRSAEGGQYTLLPPAAAGLPLRIHDLAARGVTSGGNVVFGPLPPGQYVLREIRSGAERLVGLDQSCAVDAP